MITAQDLQAAIAECQGERNPNANTCIKLAAFYTIYDHLYGSHDRLYSSAEVDQKQSYSYAATPVVENITETVIDYDSGTEFSDLIHGMRAADVWAVMDELMSVLQATRPRLYDGTMNQIRSA